MIFKVLTGGAVISVRKYICLGCRECGAWREADHCVRRRPPDCLPRDESSPCVSEMIDKFRNWLKR